MENHRRRFLKLIARVAMIALVMGGCGPSTGPSMDGIPRYPGATLRETLEGSAPLGLLGGNLQQYTTHDSYDSVMAFYREALRPYRTDVTTHAIPQGRQTAIYIEVEDGGITVAIQEFSEEEAVNITLMAVGS